MNKDVVSTRTGVGAAIGAAIGFAFAGPMGAGIGAVIGGGVAHASDGTTKGVLTPRRKVIYQRAMESIKDPTELKKLADAFAGEGLVGEASMLHKRAALRSLPHATREQRRTAFRKAMASDKPEVIDWIAKAFENEGAVDAAKALHDHAEAVRAAHLAGKSAKPLIGGSQTKFADKLAKAIIHFGPRSAQAQQAAGNLVQARGKTPTGPLVAEVIRIASDALQVPVTAPAAAVVEAATEDTETAAGTVVVEEASTDETQTVKAVDVIEAAPVEGAVSGSTGAPEATVVGPTAPALEPQVVTEGPPAVAVATEATETVVEMPLGAAAISEGTD